MGRWWRTTDGLDAGPRVALVHDWLTGMRGGEKALEVLCALYPTAEIFTLVHARGRVAPAIDGRRVHRSIVQWFPFSARFYRSYLPFFPLAVEQFDLDRFDIIISTSHCAAKAVVRPGRARHLSYCFTPMRYAWDQFDAYFGAGRVGPARSRLLRPVLRHMQRWDAATSHRVDRFVAISRHVAGRIHRYYNRPAEVVYPPVDTDFYHPDGADPERFFLIVSALVPYKRIELAIEACRLIDAPLRIVGNGPELGRLRRAAGPDVEFLGSLPSTAIRDLYRRATAVLLPGEEDFGIAPVEAQACGRPVVAVARGGALETVIDGVTGILVEDDAVEAFADGLRRVQTLRPDPAVIRAHAQGFSRARFTEAIRAKVEALATASPDDVRW